MILWILSKLSVLTDFLLEQRKEQCYLIIDRSLGTLLGLPWHPRGKARLGVLGTHVVHTDSAMGVAPIPLGSGDTPDFPRFPVTLCQCLGEHLVTLLLQGGGEHPWFNVVCTVPIREGVTGCWDWKFLLSIWNSLTPPHRVCLSTSLWLLRDRSLGSPPGLCWQGWEWAISFSCAFGWSGVFLV